MENEPFRLPGAVLPSPEVFCPLTVLKDDIPGATENAEEEGERG
jgi:hypothetical protein